MAGGCLAWMVAAFGGAYTATYVPAAVMLALAAATLRRPAASLPLRVVDWALACCLAALLVQLAPLPPAWRDLLSPRASAVERSLSLADPGPRWRALSLDPRATAGVAIVVAMMMAMFRISREVSARGEVRDLVRVVAWTGLAVATAASLVAASGSRQIYGVWPVDERARPFGPFVNRNHMGTWLVMALPLVVGYLFARWQHRTRRAASADAIDAVTIWLAGAAVVMGIAVGVSLSRSTVAGLGAAALLLAMLSLRHRVPGRWGLVGAGALAIVLVATSPRAADFSRRFQQSGTAATWSRLQIWRETLPIVRDFPLTGTGAGAYERTMLVYQTSDRTLFFNQAHNQYLQLAAEGGVLIGLPLTIAAIGLAGAVRRGLANRGAPVFWIRAGAAAGLAGALVQSLWETGLRMPANGLLFAALCGIAASGSDAFGRPGAGRAKLPPAWHR